MSKMNIKAIKAFLTHAKDFNKLCKAKKRKRLNKKLKKTNIQRNSKKKTK